MVVAKKTTSNDHSQMVVVYGLANDIFAAVQGEIISLLCFLPTVHFFAAHLLDL